MMTKRYFGLIGLRSKNANWNADFDGYPKTTPDGLIMASDKSLKYTIRRYLEETGIPVFYKKFNKISKDGKMTIGNYEDRLLEVYPKLKKLKEKKSDYETYIGILAFIGLINIEDIRMFGTAATLPKNNFSIRGVIQIGHALNKYKNTKVFEEVITNVFSGTSSAANDNVNAKREKGSSIGQMILVDEAHYFYSFSVIPETMYELSELIEEIKNNDNIKKLAKDYLDIDIDNINFYFNEKDFELFKLSALKSVTNYNSVIKFGCENSFALFIETDNDKVLVNLDDYIALDEEKNIIINNELFNVLLTANKVEIYYNPTIYKKIIVENGEKELNIGDVFNNIKIKDITNV